MAKMLIEYVFFDDEMEMLVSGDGTYSAIWIVAYMKFQVNTEIFTANY